MALTDYPVGLPLAMRDDYAFSPTNNIVRTEMQSGRARQRVEFEDAPDTLRLKWVLSAPESSLFSVWARQIVGAGWFKMTILTPLGFDEVELRFTERVSGPTLTGKYYWIWSSTCELRETPELDSGWLLLPGYVLDADIFDIAMNKLWPLNQWQIYADAADLAINQDWPTP